MPTIRIDDDVYSWLQSLAKPFEDSPNSVLRNLANLDRTGPHVDSPDSKRGKKMNNPRATSSGKSLNAKTLIRDWRVDVLQGRYHWEGTFFENLSQFPGALFDTKGYLVFKNDRDYSSSPYLNIGEKLNVPRGIASVPGYKRVVNS